MTITGVYYLHVDGDLIYKQGTESAADIRDSDFARGLWFIDPSNRMTCWNLLVEAAAAGANFERINELAAKWECNNEDAYIYAERIGCKLLQDGDAFLAAKKDFINLQESTANFAVSALYAMAGLARALGYKPSKMWGSTFKDLLEKK